MSLNWVQDAAQTLRDAGLKATPQRIAILRALDGDETHPTAQELHDRLREEFPTLSVATVYNTLSALTRMSRCVPLGAGRPSAIRPERHGTRPRGLRAVRSIRDVDLRPQPSAADTTGLSGFEVLRVERIYRGFCAQCTEAAER